MHQHQRIMQQRRMAEAAARALVPASENEMFTEPPMLTPPPNGTGRQRYKCKRWPGPTRGDFRHYRPVTRPSTLTIRCGAPKKGHKCTAVEFDFQTGQPLLPKKVCEPKTANCELKAGEPLQQRWWSYNHSSIFILPHHPFLFLLSFLR